MSKIDDGGPAFPDPMRAGEANINNQAPYQQPMGMSLRDWFAGQALAGLCGNSLLTDLFADAPDDVVDATDPTFRNVAQSAYDIADAMLAARKDGAA